MHIIYQHNFLKETYLKDAAYMIFSFTVIILAKSCNKAVFIIFVYKHSNINKIYIYRYDSKFSQVSFSVFQVKVSYLKNCPIFWQYQINPISTKYLSLPTKIFLFLYLSNECAIVCFHM